VPKSNGHPPSGTYGFRLIVNGSAAALPGLLAAEPSDEAVEVTARLGSGRETRRDVEPSRVVMSTERAGAIIVKRDPASVELLLPYEATAAALVHPLLTIPLSILARWRGDITLHGGAFHHAGAAWGVLGERTAGKSSMLGALGARSVPVAADDLLVIDERGWVRAGPPCVDLRPDVAKRLPDALYIGDVGTRPRYRLETPPAPHRSPLRGFFVLEWHDGDEPSLEPMTMAERVQVLYRQESIALIGFADPRKFIALIGMPMWRLRRRPRWSATPAALDTLLAAAEAQAPA
jgi:hypothetical protein